MIYVEEIKRLLKQNRFLIVVNGNYSPFSILPYSLKLIELIADNNLLIIPSHTKAVIYNNKFDCENANNTQEFYGNAIIHYMIGYAYTFNFRYIMYLDDDVFLNNAKSLYILLKHFIDEGYEFSGAKNYKFYGRQSKDNMSEYLRNIVEKYSINMYFLLIDVNKWIEKSVEINSYVSCDKDRIMKMFPEMTDDEYERFDRDWLDEPYSKIFMGAVHELNEMEVKCPDMGDYTGNFIGTGVTLDWDIAPAMYHLWYSRVHSENFQKIDDNSKLAKEIKIQVERMHRLNDYASEEFIKYLKETE